MRITSTHLTHNRRIGVGLAAAMILASAPAAVADSCPNLHPESKDVNAQATVSDTDSTAGEAMGVVPLFVDVAEYEKIDRIRVKTDRTRSESSGDQVPVYEFFDPDPGMFLVRLTLNVATEQPRMIEYEDIELFLGDTVYEPEWVFRDATWTRSSGGLLVDAKARIQTAFAVPQADWDSLELRVVGQVFPLEVKRLENPAPADS